MVGTRSIFHLVPVTKALSNAVAAGQYPEAQTTVEKCMTSLGHNRRVNEGMEMPEYRRVAFERFLAFKALAKELSCKHVFIQQFPFSHFETI
jgi:hypothetical protein